MCVADAAMTESCLSSFSLSEAQYCRSQPELCSSCLSDESNQVHSLGLRVTEVAENPHFSVLEQISAGC